MCVKLLSVKFVCVKFVCVKLLYVKFVCVKFVCVKFVCVKLLSVKFVCVKFVCVKLLYVKFVCVVLRRRREEEEKPGIQNQKQEPHTKMWGKINKTKKNNKEHMLKKHFSLFFHIFLSIFFHGNVHHPASSRHFRWHRGQPKCSSS